MALDQGYGLPTTSPFSKMPTGGIGTPAFNPNAPRRDPRRPYDEDRRMNDSPLMKALLAVIGQGGGRNKRRGPRGGGFGGNGPRPFLGGGQLGHLPAGGTPDYQISGAPTEMGALGYGRAAPSAPAAPMFPPPLRSMGPVGPGPVGAAGAARTGDVGLLDEILAEIMMPYQMRRLA